MMGAVVKATAVCLAAGMLMAANGDGGADRNDNRTVWQVEVRDRTGRTSTAAQLLVVGDGPSRLAEASRGMARRNQNRVDYSAIPYLGKLSEHRYDKADFAAGTEVGIVRVGDGRLVLVLDEGAPVRPDAIARIAVLNGEVAYETRGGVGAGDGAGRGAWPTYGRAIGTLHWRGDDTLLALIRPFVVTDSALW